MLRIAHWIRFLTMSEWAYNQKNSKISKKCKNRCDRCPPAVFPEIRTAEEFSTGDAMSRLPNVNRSEESGLPSADSSVRACRSL